MVCKACNMNSNREITKDLLEQMTDEIYRNLEPEEQATTRIEPQLKNGDVINPNAKEPEMRGETRQQNFMLRDLIQILILRELLRRRNQRPPMPPPPRPPRPMQPPRRPYYKINV